VFEGMSIGEFMRALPVKVTTHNIGQIDSIANVIFAAGTTRYASKNASFLFHGVTMHYEKKDFIESQLEEQYLNLKRMRENIAATFATYSGLSLAVTEALMISGATILSSHEALSKAIIHEVRDAAIPSGSQVIAIGNA
jgi:ATP-dependent Clp protease, protease subunit